MKHHRINFASSVLIAAAIGSVLWVNAGQLVPPAGAITATGPTTLNQADIGAGPLFALNTSGSYILTSDIVAPALYAGDGIAIDADNVTLNMNGFALIGVGGSMRGIRVTVGPRFNISIYNGTVRDWGGDGVDAGLAENSQLRNLRVYENGGTGMILGEGGTITGCTAYVNGNDGINAGFANVVSGCVADSNFGDGINASTGSTVSGCVAIGNLGDGIEALDSLIKGNSSTNNVGTAINDTGGSVLVDNNT